MKVHPLIVAAAGRLFGDTAAPAGPDRRSPRARRLAVGTVLTGVALCVWTLTAPTGPDRRHADDVAAAFTTAVIAGGGALLLAGSDHDGRFRRPLGLALLLAAAGHLLVHTGGYSTPVQQTLILLWTLPAIGCCLVGLAGRPPRSDPLMPVRSLLEAALLGVMLGAALWQQVFRPYGAPFPLVYTLLPVTATVCAVLVFALRSTDPGLRVAAGAVAGLVLAGVLALHLDLVRPQAQDPGTYWMALAALLWPPLVIGLLTSRGGGTGPDSDWVAGNERLSTMAVSVLVLAFSACALAGMVTRGVDTPTLVLCGAAIVLLWLRELVRAHQNLHLVDDISAQAATDPMTGLPNRRGLEEQITRLRRRPPGPVGIITVDIDRFREVNDLLGQARGDALIVATSQELAHLARAAAGQTFRMGGAEFVLLVQADLASTRALAAHAADVMTRAAARVPGTVRFQLSCSVGLDGSWAEDPPADLSSVLLRSGHAMRHAKATGARTAVFSPAMADAMARRQAVEQRLRAGLDDIDVRFQPILSLDDRRVIGVEALARWHDHLLGDVPPREFLTVAEQSGQMERLGLHLLRRALRHTQTLDLAGAGIHTWVNVSTLELRIPGFARRFRQETRSAGLRPADLVVEVSEAVLDVRGGSAVKVLGELEAEGFRIVLDGFGAGYSSLALLTTLPVHGLKLDRGLTGRLPDARADAIAAVLTQLATDLGLGVVAAGVETADQEAALRRHGLWHVQGWRYAQALDLRGLEDYLRAGGGP